MHALLKELNAHDCMRSYTGCECMSLMIKSFSLYLAQLSQSGRGDGSRNKSDSFGNSNATKRYI